MKITLFKTTAILFLSFMCLSVFSQTAKPAANKAKTKNYPETFVITKSEYDQMFAYKANDVVRLKTNKYLNNSKVILKNYVEENKQLHLKLSYFSKANLYIQVNGNDSQQLFIMSDDNSVFYRSKTEKDRYIMIKCEKDEIVSE